MDFLHCFVIIHFVPIIPGRFQNPSRQRSYFNSVWSTVSGHVATYKLFNRYLLNGFTLLNIDLLGDIVKRIVITVEHSLDQTCYVLYQKYIRIRYLEMWDKTQLPYHFRSIM